MNPNPYKFSGSNEQPVTSLSASLRRLRILFGAIFGLGLLVSFYNNYITGAYAGDAILYLQSLSPVFVLVRIGVLTLFVHLVRYPVFRHVMSAWYVLGLCAVVALVLIKKNNPILTDWLALAIGILAFAVLYISPQAKLYYSKRGRGDA